MCTAQLKPALSLDVHSVFDLGQADNMFIEAAGSVKELGELAPQSLHIEPWHRSNSNLDCSEYYDHEAEHRE